MEAEHLWPVDMEFISLLHHPDCLQWFVPVFRRSSQLSLLTRFVVMPVKYSAVTVCYSFDLFLLGRDIYLTGAKKN